MMGSGRLIDWVLERRPKTPFPALFVGAWAHLQAHFNLTLPSFLRLFALLE
jgi:hypothetical protein